MNVTNAPITAAQLVLQGHVQGIGLRPAVARFAQHLALAGSVRNSAEGVMIHVEGEAEQVETFCSGLLDELPCGADVSGLFSQPCPPQAVSSFRIIDSQTAGPLTARVPADRATCAECLQEVQSAGDRRHQYAITSCTNCGPRYSIIEAMPYDRRRTSMREFALCSRCRDEDEDSTNRRFHAQTNACPECGPRLWIGSGADDADAPITVAACAVASGKVLAMRGLGGYQLVVDATNQTAVARLRQRKGRAAKPLAVMVGSLVEAEQIADLTEVERRLLAGSERPIVVVREKSSGPLADGVHPGMSQVGLFLPTTPLHQLLLDELRRPLVVTSGNVDGDPLETDPRSAEETLSGIADVWLHHNREIVRRIDDSVTRVMDERPVILRNARGYAPTALLAVERLAQTGKSQVLAVGGHQKNAIALFNGRQAVLGPHLGDLESLANRQRFLEHVEQFQRLYDCEPQLILHDLHPDYFTTQWAESTGARTLAVQHHHAHIVSGMVENDWLDREVLSVAFDGTGYGTDGTIWGGEFLRATTTGFERVGHLQPFRLLGGERAVREPWRVAAALLHDAGLEFEQNLVIAQASRHTILSANGIATVFNGANLASTTTSAGRLFDGVAALVFGLEASQFEGQPAMLLESVADRTATGAYDFDVSRTSPAEIDWRPMMRELMSDIRQNALPAVISARFHRGLAQSIVTLCRRFELPVVLSGGVFQNRLLTEWVVTGLREAEIEFAVHSRIPPNDGGLAAGQLAIGLATMRMDATTKD